MKKFILPLVFMAFLTSGYQNMHAENQDEKPVTFGVEAGWNLSKPADGDDPSMRSGFNVGATVRWNFTSHWSLDGGLRVTSKPWKYSYRFISDDPADDDYHKTKTTPYFLEIPVTANYRVNVSNSTQVFMGLGPYLAVGLGGNYKRWVVDNGVKLPCDYDGDPFSDDKNPIEPMRRFQIGALCRVGVRLWQHYSLSAEYQLQINEMGRNLLSGRSQMLSINLGYEF